MISVETNFSRTSTPLLHTRVSHETELHALQPRWDELAAAGFRPSPFLLHDWLTTWWRHFGHRSRLAVHLAWRGEDLVGALPLFEATWAGVRVARFVGAPDSTLADVLVDQQAGEEVARTLVQAALGAHGLLDLFAIAPESWLSRVVAPQAVVPRTEAPTLKLDGGWEATYERKTSSRRRALYRRRWRQLETEGEPSVRLERAGASFDSALEDAFRLHAMRWRGRGDVSTFGDERGWHFHRDALGALSRRGFTRLVVLELSGRPIAFTLYFAFAGRMFIYRLAFDPHYARFSPGILTTLEAIRLAADEGLSTVEFLRGSERYKIELADRVDVLGEVVLDGGSLVGRAAGTLLASRTRLRRWLSAHRRSVRESVQTHTHRAASQ
jgi:CelD/BcsL family acetyltransferase involved in cellulose biosynthesis